MASAFAKIVFWRLALPTKKITKQFGKFISSAIDCIVITFLNRNIPLSILTVDSNGEVTVDRSPLLNSREQTFPIDTSKPFKLNSGNSGVCQFSLMANPTLFSAYG